MSNKNRGRILVDLAGEWQIYTPAPPTGSVPLGTVTSNGETGALARVEASGIYVQVNANRVKSLDQRKVQAAIDAANGNGGR